jgi:hypothetical protein
VQTFIRFKLRYAISLMVAIMCVAGVHGKRVSTPTTNNVETAARRDDARPTPPPIARSVAEKKLAPRTSAAKKKGSRLAPKRAIVGAVPQIIPYPFVPIDGMLGHIEQCEDFFLDSVLWPEGGTVFQIFGTIFGDHDLPDPAWVLVQKNRTGTHRKFRDATGVIAQSVFVGDYTGGPVRGDDPLKSFNVEGDESVVNFEDYPDVHDTHDQNFYLKLDPDPSQADLISSFGIDSRGYTREDEGYYAPDTLEVEWETGILTISSLATDASFQSGRGRSRAIASG